MAKRSIVFLSILIILLALAGCGGDETPEPTATVQPTEPPATTEPTATAPPPTPTAEMAAAEEPAIAGRWQGVLSVQDAQLDIFVDISAANGGFEGTIDVPQQGAAGIALTNVSFEDGGLHFEMLSGPQKATFEGELQADGTIAGTFEQAGFQGEFDLQPAPAQAEAPPAPQTYEDPAGRFSVPLPANWTAEEAGQYGVLTDPDGKIVVYVLALEGDDIETAVAEGWDMVDPEFDPQNATVQEQPASGGVEKVLSIEYDVGDEERFVLASGTLYDGVVYMTLVDADLNALMQRSSQFGIILSGFDIAGLEEVDLAGVEPKPLTGDLAAELEAYVNEALEKFNVPGAAVAVVRDGEIVYAKGFGERDPETGDPVTPDTQMMIGSTTKTFTTMLMARLVDEGLMAWDTPAVELLPNFAVADPDLTPKITVRNLVCNCTGVSRRDLELLFNANDLSAEGVVESLKTFEFFTDFGEAFQYSNQMIATGGYAAAAAAGGEYGNLYAAYADALQTQILDPIGMPGTTLSFDAVTAGGNYATPHGLDLSFEYKPIPLSAEEFVTPVAPAGALWSTANDMGRYLITELNRGVAPDGTRVVSAENLETTWEPQVPVTADTSYGLGWFVSSFKGQRMLDHGGGTVGFTSDLAFLPDAGLGISVLSNARASLFNEAVRYRLFELVFDLPQEFDANVTFSFDRFQQEYANMAAPLKPEADPDAVAPYLGTFTNDALGEIVLDLQAGTLVMDAGEFQSELWPEVNEDGETVRYVAYDAPAMVGLPVELTEDDAGNPIVVFGLGATEYTFEKAK